MKNIAETPTELAEEVRKFAAFASKDEREEFMAAIINEHRTNQQKVVSLFVELCYHLDEERKKGHFDLRNEASVNIAQKVMEETNGARGLPNI